MLREFPSGLAHVPLDRVEVIEGGLSGLRRYVTSRAWEDASADGFLLVREGEIGDPLAAYYPFDVEAFRILATRALMLGEEDMNPVRLQEIFHVHESSASPEISPEEEIGRPATIIEAGKPIAIHVPPPWRDANRERRPPAVIVGAGPSPVAPKGKPRRRRRAARPQAPVPPGPKPVPKVLRRTPHMDLSDEAPAPGSAFQVFVYADTTPPRAEKGEETEDVAVELPPEVEELDLRVWLVPTSHFTVLGTLLQTLRITRDEERSTLVTFDVRVHAGARDAARAAITANFSYRGRASGKVTRRIRLAPRGQAADERTRARPRRVRAKSLTADLAACVPDLTVEVSEPDDGDGRRFHCRVTTPHLEKWKDAAAEPWNLKQITRDFVFERMELFTKEGISDNQRLARLEAAGVDFFEKSPPNFQNAFWDLVDSRKPFSTIYVISSEPYIPWELMVPHRITDGEKEEHQPLGVEFVVGRWPDKERQSPVQLRPIEDSYVIAPTYTGSRRLEEAAEEADLVKSRFRGELIAPADFDSIDTALARRGTSLIHFVCHGEAGAGTVQVIRLDDPDKTLTSLELKRMKGAMKAFGEKQPLVFLNACEVGRPVPSLVGIGGFASEFVELGASCVIAPLWSVKDSIAHDVAVEFYETVLAEPTRTFAEVLRQIRAKAYTEEGFEDTYAAYCFYGDPLAAGASAWGNSPRTGT